MAAPKLKPKLKPKKLTLKRSKSRYIADWQVPAAMKNERRDDRYEKLYWTWRVDEAGVKTKKDPQEREHRDSVNAHRDTLNINDWTSTRPKNRKFTRESFYPYTSKRLNAIRITVRGHNRKGFSPPANAKFTFDLPAAPKIAISYNPDNGDVKVTVTSDAGDGVRERADTMIRMAAWREDGKQRTIMGWTSTTKTSWSVTKDSGKPADMGGLSVDFSRGQTLTVGVWAYCRGIHGDNPSKDKAVYKQVLLAYPNKATIDASKIYASSLEDSGRVRIPISVGGYTEAVQLQRRHGEDGSWEDVQGAVDDRSATALYDSVGEAVPLRGEKIYYRIKSTRGNFITYSDAVWAKPLYTPLPTSGSSRVGIVSAVPNPDGTSCEVVVGWTEGEPWTGTEISWASNLMAWESTKPPETFEATWSDATSKSTSWGKTMTITIMDLKPGMPYHVKARRYLESDVGTQYSPYSGSESFQTTSEGAVDTQLGAVVLSAPPYVRRGESIQLTWVGSGTQTQTGYAVHPEGNAGVSLASGSGSAGTAKIEPERYGDADSVTVYVDVTYPSGSVSSQTRTIGIDEQPDCVVGVAGTVTSKDDAEFEVYSSGTPSRIEYVVSADPDNGGMSGYTPDDSRDQLKGDAVATGAVTPVWAEVDWSVTAHHAYLQSEVARASDEVDEAQATVDGMDPTDEGYNAALAELEVAREQLAAAQDALAANTGTVNMAVVPIPSDAELVDGAVYRVEASTVSAMSGFASEKAYAVFSVRWSHQAVEPSDSISVAVNEEARTATVTLAPATGHVQGDMYDLYRYNGEGFDRIAAALSLDAVVTDRWAPFGDGMYRVCTRTADGDMEWADYSYSLAVDKVRFDWQGGSCELEPHNLKTSDSYKKQFEARTHIDGTVNGYWRQGVQRTGSVSATILMPYEDDAKKAINQMAQHAGPCMCRTPEGQAYQCDAEVSLNGSHVSPLIDASVTISKVQLTSDFMPRDGDVAGAIIDGG